MQRKRENKCHKLRDCVSPLLSRFFSLFLSLAASAHASHTKRGTVRDADVLVDEKGKNMRSQREGEKGQYDHDDDVQHDNNVFSYVGKRVYFRPRIAKTGKKKG